MKLRERDTLLEVVVPIVCLFLGLLQDKGHWKRFADMPKGARCRLNLRVRQRSRFSLPKEHGRLGHPERGRCLH